MSQQHQPPNFWDFIQSFDPNRNPGGGVDHAPPFSFPVDFPFGPQGHQRAGPGGPQSWGGEFGWGGPWGWGGGRGGPWGGPDERRRRHGGRHGRRGGRGGGGRRSDDEEDREVHDGGVSEEERRDVDMDGETEKEETPDTMRAGDFPDPDEVAPEEGDETEGPHHHRRHGGRGGRGGFGGRRGGPGMGGCRRGRHGGPGPGPHGFHGHHHHGPPPPPPFPVDIGGLIRGFAQHPFVQNIREQAENYRQQQRGGNNNNDNDASRDVGEDNVNENENNGDDGSAFTPPVDIFNTERAYVLHVALPGAKKEDIGVNWDADRSTLTIAGVIHRPGDEAFLQTLTSGERRIGMFERRVVLPPPSATSQERNERDEVDAGGITARMEDGVLVIVVPKVEKEWTEIRKVDIE